MADSFKSHDGEDTQQGHRRITRRKQHSRPSETVGRKIDRFADSNRVWVKSRRRLRRKLLRR